MDNFIGKRIDVLMLPIDYYELKNETESRQSKIAHGKKGSPVESDWLGRGGN